MCRITQEISFWSCLRGVTLTRVTEWTNTIRKNGTVFWVRISDCIKASCTVLKSWEFIPSMQMIGPAACCFISCSFDSPVTVDHTLRLRTPQTLVFKVFLPLYFITDTRKLIWSKNRNSTSSESPSTRAFSGLGKHWVFWFLCSSWYFLQIAPSSKSTTS